MRPTNEARIYAQTVCSERWSIGGNPDRGITQRSSGSSFRQGSTGVGELGSTIALGNGNANRLVLCQPHDEPSVWDVGHVIETRREQPWERGSCSFLWGSPPFAGWRGITLTTARK